MIGIFRYRYRPINIAGASSTKVSTLDVSMILGYTQMYHYKFLQLTGDAEKTTLSLYACHF